MSSKTENSSLSFFIFGLESFSLRNNSLTDFSRSNLQRIEENTIYNNVYKIAFACLLLVQGRDVPSSI
jgi:hypothetical protein